ncbi:unnamed protein product [Trichobilharzia szidati]|nr:unnamed protein product [Trichobilharzia szidati]
MDFLKTSFGWNNAEYNQNLEETWNVIYQNSMKNYYTIMNSLSKCTTLSESTNDTSQLCSFNSNPLAYDYNTAIISTTNNDTTINNNSTIEKYTENNEQNEPINLCIRDQHDATAYKNGCDIKVDNTNNNSNIICPNNIQFHNIISAITNDSNTHNNNNINNTNSLYFTDITNRLNTGYLMNPNYAINMNHSSMTSSEFKLIPDCLNPFLLMNFNNMYDNMSNSNISNNIKGHSMYSTLRTPSPTIQQHQQQSEVGGVFLTSTPVWRKQKAFQHENLNKSPWLSGEQQAGEMQTTNTENMKWRKYSRHPNRFGYSRNKVLQAQRKLQRKFNNHIVNSDQNGDQNAGDSSSINNNNKPRMHRSSSGRRRRVGWRGTTICANCGMIFEGMNHLNHHYSLVHGHLLTTELTSTQYSNNKTSKLLFQAQLDLLISEKASKDGCPTSTSTPSSSLSTSDDHIQQSKSPLPPPPVSSSSAETVVISGDCINSPCVESTITTTSTTTTATLTLTTMTTLPTPAIQPIKSYPCPKCNYTAKWPTELQKHVMVHANSRPFVCCVCATSYKWSWDLGRHFTNSHPNLPNPYKRQRNNKQQQQPQQQQQQWEEPSTLKQEDL